MVNVPGSVTAWGRSATDGAGTPLAFKHFLKPLDRQTVVNPKLALTVTATFRFAFPKYP